MPVMVSSRCISAFQNCPRSLTTNVKVSRPCKRCVTLGKSDTCQDIQHKKRGRPRLRDKRANGSAANGQQGQFEVMYGTIQTPAFAVSSAEGLQTNIAAISGSNDKPITRAAGSTSSTGTISFIHEFQANPPRSEQQQQQQSPSSPTAINAFSPSKSPLKTALQYPTHTHHFESGSDFVQQFFIPTYASSMPVHSMQQTERAPESMSLQMKMENAYAQRPPQLPLAPTNHSQGISARKDSASTSSSKQGTGSNDNDQTVTIIMSMEVCCAKVTEEVTSLWGYYPQEFAHRSFYDFVSSRDTDRLARLHRLLLDNIVDVAKRDNRPDGKPPPQTERTSSDAFHNADIAQLVDIAPGSSTFSDTIHIKKQSGEEELYEMIVCMGGGLGADLHKPESLSKLYMIAQLRKHQYEVSTKSPFTSIQRLRSMSGSFDRSPSTVRDGNSAQSSAAGSSDGRRSPTPSKSKNLSLKNKFHNIRPSPSSSFRDLRSRPLIPAHYASSSQLNTVSKLGPAKVNIAPITSNAGRQEPPSWMRRLDSTIPPGFRSSSSSIPSGPSPNLPPLSSARESSNPYSTLAYRFAPSADGSPRGNPNVTHPTTQYFLQTPSSTLNAAASAAQHSSRTMSLPYQSSMADNDKASGKTDTNRNVEMSIRSLLC